MRAAQGWYSIGSMESTRIFPVFLAAATIAALCLPLAAQTGEDIPASQFKVKIVHETPPPMPFPPATETPGSVYSIELRSPSQMTQQDRNVEADGESSIRERVSFSGLEFNEGKWSYQQLVCPALPNHVLLRFTRNNGAGDVSVFSASIPRGGDGRVRIIPILRRGYSLFSPAPINALTISAFNHIRAEEHPDGAPDWLGTGLCYAALAGAHPLAAQVEDHSQGQGFPSAIPAMLEIPKRGGAIIKFADVAATPRPMEWTMTFNGKGKLLKATHAPAVLLKAKVITPAPVDLRGKPIQ
jgi:hypothetical protein